MMWMQDSEPFLLCKNISKSITLEIGPPALERCFIEGTLVPLPFIFDVSDIRRIIARRKRLNSAGQQYA
jgi:hypothetical protein